jgi:poly(A) polymerase
VTYLQPPERRGLIKWAALLHGIGNPVAGQEAEQGGQSALSAAVRSAQQWEHIGSRLKLSRQRIDYIKTLIAHHQRPVELALLQAQGRLTLRLVYGWCKELGEEILGAFALAIGIAIAKGQVDTAVLGARALGRFASHVWDLYHQRILPVLRAPRLLTGNDLQRVFHLTPGPQFKTLLDALEVAQVEGHVRTRAEALQWVEEYLARC